MYLFRSLLHWRNGRSISKTAGVLFKSLVHYQINKDRWAASPQNKHYLVFTRDFYHSVEQNFALSLPEERPPTMETRADLGDRGTEVFYYRMAITYLATWVSQAEYHSTEREVIPRT